MPRRAGTCAGSTPASPFREIEGILEDAGVSPELLRLVDERCNRMAVLAALTRLHHLDRKLDTLDFWTGLTRRQLKGLLRRLNDDAADVESLNGRPPYGSLLAARAGAAELVALPDILRRWAAVCQNLLDEVTGQKHLHQDMAVATLVRHVVLSTGRFRDREVSALVSAALRREYSTKVHQAWRRAKYSRLARALDREDRRRADTVLGPPPPASSGGSV
jgi:hypothetical protein